MEANTYVEMSEAVIRLKISERTIRRKIGAGELTAKKRGRKWYVEINDGAIQKIALSEHPIPQEINGAIIGARNQCSPPEQGAYKPRPHSEHQADSSDFIDVATGIGRLAPWRNLRKLLNEPLTPASRQIVLDAATAILEGFMAIGNHKIDCYRAGRAKICELLILLGSAPQNEQSKVTNNVAAETLGALQALIIKMSKQRKKEVLQ